MTRSRCTFAVLSAIGMLLFGSDGHADVMLAQWTFETSPPADLTDSATIGPLSADVGTGSANGVHASATTDWTTPTGNGSANSLSATTWAMGDYWQFSTSTVGFMDITLAWDQTSSNTGPRDFKVQYSTNGTTYTDFGSTYALVANVSPNDWTSGTFKAIHHYTADLGAISELDNQSSVFFRLTVASAVAANNGAIAAGGTSRVDNFTINGLSSGGAAVPEPSSLILLSLASAGGWARWTWKRRRPQNPSPACQ